MHFDPEAAVLAAAKACEADVFLNTYGNTSEQWEEEYGPYDDASVFLTITEPGGDAVATSRLILPNPNGLKTLVDVARDPWFIDGNRSARLAGMQPALTWDIATVAVRKGVAGSGFLSAALYHGMVVATRVNRLRWIVMIMDVRARRLLSMLNLQTQVLPEATAGSYLGSAASVPIWADAARMLADQRAKNPDASDLINYGIGLDDIALPPPGDFVLNRTTWHRPDPDQAELDAPDWASRFDISLSAA
jgi:hypothetical protein